MISLGLTVFSSGMITVAAVIAWMVGMLWYSPLMFGKRWMALANVHMDKSRRMFACIALDTITIFLQTYMCAWLIEALEAWSFLDAYLVGIILVTVWLILPLGAIFAWERRSWELFILHISGIMVTFFVIIGILLYIVS